MSAAADGTPRYTRTAIVLHWSTFALIAAGFALGLYMTGLTLSPAKLQMYSWHKWIGATVFLLALARIVWRLTHAAPPWPPGLPAWQRRGAAAVHVALYVLIVAIPLSGWLHSSAAGVPTVYLGLVPLPDLVARDKALAEFMQTLHVALNYALFVLFSVHAGAALKHHFVDCDGVLARMLPAVAPRDGR
jgi:cytochrome b561